MSTDATFESTLRLAALLESAGRFDDAAATYQQAIAAIDPADRSLVGTLRINVGNAVRSAGRFDEAIAWYRKATELLDGLKGEALLQRGYAFLNMARLLLDKDDPEAVSAAAEALKLHRAYPYTPKADLADAVLLHSIASLFLTGVASEAELAAAWEEIRGVRCSELMRNAVFDFTSNYLLLIRQIDADRYLAIRAEVEQWALPDLFEEIVALAEGGCEAYEAVKLRHRLQRALFGIPDPEEG